MDSHFKTEIICMDEQFHIMGYYKDELELFEHYKHLWEERKLIGKKNISTDCESILVLAEDRFDFLALHPKWHLRKDTNDTWEKYFEVGGYRTKVEAEGQLLKIKEFPERYEDITGHYHKTYQLHLENIRESLYCDCRYWSPINSIDSEWVV